MKIINFSVVEILPHLLNKTKTQTIRPAWKEELGNPLADQDIISVNTRYKEIPYKKWNEKPPRFKVGDHVQLYWKQRGKYKWFCQACGVPAKEDGSKISCEHHGYDTFNKLLGTAKITEVFKIEMYKTYFKYQVTGKGQWLSCDDEYDLKQFAKRDGFRDGVIPIKAGVSGSYFVETAVEQMFKTIDKMYDLSSPKTFYIYRWVWK